MRLFGNLIQELKGAMYQIIVLFGPVQLTPVTEEMWSITFYCVVFVYISSSVRALEIDLNDLKKGSRARICQRLKSLGIDSKESIPPAYVVWPNLSY